MGIVRTVLLFALCLWNGAYGQANEKPTVVVVLGTRPDVIKLSSTIQILRNYYQSYVSVQILSTGQHRELLQPLLQLFDIDPHVHLDLMDFSRNGSATFVGRSIELISNNLNSMNPKPAAVVVQGDTNTALAAAMGAFYCRIPVVHIEAGLRTWDITAPFPEEFNRRAISLIAAISLAPTERSKENLIKDGVDLDSIVVTGNTVIDSAQLVLSKPLSPEEQGILKQIEAPLYAENSSNKKRYVLISSNRQENFGQPLGEIIEAVKQLAMTWTDTMFLFLLHMNPQSRGPVTAALPGIANVLLLDPVEYVPFLHLLAGAALIVSDSGGMQEEAAALGVPCIVLR